MKTNVCWKTEYYVKVKGCIVGMVYHHDEQYQWTVHIRTKTKSECRLIFDGLSTFNIKAVLSETDSTLINVIIDLDNDDTYLGGYLPPKYEELLEKLSTVVLELLSINEKLKEKTNG